MRREFNVLFCLLLAFSPPSFSSESEMQAADTLAMVESLAADLEAIRIYMGKPAHDLNRFRVEFATSNHVLYQAQTLYRKINRLGIEVAGMNRQSPPSAPNRSVEPGDVLRALKRIEPQIQLIQSSLGIENQTPEIRRNPNASPKDTLERIVDVNRMVNLMLDDPFRPEDVYEQLSLASVYLFSVAVKRDLPDYPSVPFEPNKTPADVYNKLIDCLALNQQIGEQLGQPVMQIRPNRLRRKASILSDNYDIATMLLGDIAMWTATLEHDEDSFPETTTLPHIFPAHVFQSAMVIEKQLQALE